ncbi:MAG: ribosomal protein S18-alanine N-acetyltransferase [Gemmatimonadaceae bacterium]
MTGSRAAIAIGPVQIGDLSSIVELEKTAFADPWSRASFESILAEPAVYFAAARDGDRNEIVGYVVAWFAADEGEVANLAVREPTRRRGIGAALLDATLGEARRRGALMMFLEVRQSNEAARGLYASRGFEEVGRRSKYYQHPVEDAIILRREMGGEH